MRAGSSPAALLESLKGLEKRFEHEELQVLSKRARQVKQSEKARQLIALLEQGKHNKTLVFINHRATQSDLAKALTAAGIEHAQFRGDLSLKAKDAAIERFRESVPVMLASETGERGATCSLPTPSSTMTCPGIRCGLNSALGGCTALADSRRLHLQFLLG